MTNEEIRERVQENIIAYIEKQMGKRTQQFKEELCQIVVDCFTEDRKKNDSSRYQNHPEEVYARDWMNGKKC